MFALVALFGAIDFEAERKDRWPPLVAAMIAGTAPMYWLASVRPLSDMAGLSAAVAVQALSVTAATTRAVAMAAFLAGFAAGIRSQVLWLTVPQLAFVLARRERRSAWPAALAALAAGIVAWFIPLVVVSGGPAAYWRAVVNQGSEDLTGVQMLWTTRTVRQLLAALNSSFLAPWGSAWMAGIIVTLAIVGAVRLYRRNRPGAAVLLVAFGPYLAFDLLFQESITTRYALPLIVPLAFLVVSAVTAAPPAIAVVAALCLAAVDAHVGGRAIAAYASEPAPAFRLLRDMRQSAGGRRDAPVLAMHRREDLDLRRPMTWTDGSLPHFAGRLAAPPKHEWLELVDYWNASGGAPVWFVADPRRTDLALVDRRDAWVEHYRWALDDHALIGGVRPDEMDWYRFREPSWYLGDGWSLTPETAGVAAEDGRGPGRGGIQGWMKRWSEPATLMIGGRLLSTSGPAAHVRVAVDGRPVDEPAVDPGFFLRFVDLPPPALAGAGSHAALTISADSPLVAIEQFDAQPARRVVWGFGDGWQEAEYNPGLGREWRWASERAALRVHAAGQALIVTLAGEPPSVYFSQPSHVVIRAGGRIVADALLSQTFSIRANIPAELVADPVSAITIETGQMYVPAERSRRSRDRRHLALRVYECSIRAAGPP